MDGPAQHSLPIPRLRVTRHGIPQADDTGMSSQAGPSRLPPGPYVDLTGDHEKHDEDEDAQATPRIPFNPPLAAHESLPVDTPAARLRALLARVPNSGNSKSSPPYPPAPASPTELESDFDPPNPGPPTPSFARESLKELFSKALRDPGDTPQKGRRRRNSIDLSEVEGSPRLNNVELENTKNKNKRGSLSDEEVEKLSKSHQYAETSMRSTQATTYDFLRERLMNSHANGTSELLHMPLPEMSIADHSDAPADVSEDTATLLRELNSSSASPPVATSTPVRSMQMPSQLQMNSNLMEQDSEMQRAMDGLDSYEGESGPSSRPLSFPPPRTPHAQPTPSKRPSSLVLPSKSPLHERIAGHGKTLSRHGSVESLGRPSSQMSFQSNADHREHHDEFERERNYEREREWGRPQPKTPARPGSDHHHRAHSHQPHLSSPGNSSGHSELTRRRSTASLLSSDGSVPHGLTKKASAASLLSSGSSRRDSFGSQTGSHLHGKDQEEAQKHARELAWNRRHSQLSSTNLMLHTTAERKRTVSQPTRPDSAMSMQSTQSAQSTHSIAPRTHRLHRHSSSASLSSDRSRTSSVSDLEKSQENEVKHIVDYQRERNWNSPHPKWVPPTTPKSPPPLSRSSSPLLSPTHSHTHSHTRPRSRLDSLGIPSPRGHDDHTHTKPHLLRSSTSHTSLNAKGKTPEAVTLASHTTPSNQPSPHTHLTRASSHPSPRSQSPLPPSKSVLNPSEKSDPGPTAGKSPSFNARTTFQFPSRSRSPLPPFEPDVESPARPSTDKSEAPSRSRHLSSPSPMARPESKVSGSGRNSHIPIPTQRHSQGSLSKVTASSDAERKKGHRRSLTEFSASVGAIPPRIKIDFDPALPPADPVILHPDSVFASDEESPPSVTPTVRFTGLSVEDSPVDIVTPTLSRPQLLVEEAKPAVIPDAPPSPEPSSPLLQPQPALSLATPPRRQSFSASKVAEFKTPSPPRGLPELPGPPSSSDDDTVEIKNWTPDNQNGNFSSLKTPKPPGAWAATPAPVHRSPVHMHSLPDVNGTGGESEPEPETDDGRTTPVARSRALSLPAQTPVPPGAWTQTPGSLRRKSFLKVRFEVETSESEVSHADIPLVQDTPAIVELPPHVNGIGSSDESEDKRQATGTVSPATIIFASQEPHLNGVAQQSSAEDHPEPRAKTPEIPSTPPPDPAKPLRRSPSIRLVDAFGRETSAEPAVEEKKEEQVVAIIQSEPQPEPQPVLLPPTPRSKSAVKIVDAMGREVSEKETDEQSERSTVEDFPLTHDEALARVRATVADLRDEFSEADQSSLDLEDRRLSELEEVSKAARDVRDSLSQSLRMVRSAEDDFRSKYGPLRESMRRSKLLPNVAKDRRLSWVPMNPWALCAFILLQVALLAFMYRITTNQVRHLFLTTYYDPSDPDLYTHIGMHDTLRYSSMSAPSWSIFSIPDTLRRAGFKGVLTEILGGMSGALRDWQHQAWHAFGGDEARTKWPPT